MHLSLSDKILGAIETLEALYFLTESLEAHQERIQMMRREFRRLSRKERKELLDELEGEVEDIRGQSGAIAPNSTFRRLLADVRRQPGLAYLPKIFIDAKLFRHYDKVFRRWPHVKQHALAGAEELVPLEKQGGRGGRKRNRNLKGTPRTLTCLRSTSVSPLFQQSQTVLAQAKGAYDWNGAPQGRFQNSCDISRTKTFRTECDSIKAR